MQHVGDASRFDQFFHCIGLVEEFVEILTCELLRFGDVKNVVHTLVCDIRGRPHSAGAKIADFTPHVAATFSGLSSML